MEVISVEDRYIDRSEYVNRYIYKYKPTFCENTKEYLEHTFQTNIKKNDKIFQINWTHLSKFLIYNQNSHIPILYSFEFTKDLLYATL